MITHSMTGCTRLGTCVTFVLIPSKELDRFIEISIDETIIPFKRTSSLGKYNPSKPHKWGFTVWSLADPQSGYVYNWDIHSGNPSSLIPRAQNNDRRGIVYWTVWDILETVEVLDKEHHIYVHNLFLFPALFEDLATQEPGASGNLRTNRKGVPEVIKRAKQSKSDPPVTS